MRVPQILKIVGTICFAFAPVTMALGTPATVSLVIAELGGACNMLAARWPDITPPVNPVPQPGVDIIPLIDNIDPDPEDGEGDFQEVTTGDGDYYNELL